MRRLLAGLVPLAFTIVSLLGLARRPVDVPLAGLTGDRIDDLHDELDRPLPSMWLDAPPALSAHYFRGDGGYVETRLALDFSPNGQRPSEFEPREARLQAWIREFDAEGRLMPHATNVLIEREEWTTSRAAPSLHRSSARLLPGRYWLEIFADNAGTVATIDRILEVPSFPDGELGVSSVVAVLEEAPSSATAAARGVLTPKVAAFAEAYAPSSLNGPTTVSARFTLSRGEQVVREWSYDFHSRDGNVPILERFDTKSLEPGPYLLLLKVSLCSEQESVSSRLELTIDETST